MRRPASPSIVLALIALLLSACNAPSPTSPEEAGVQPTLDSVTAAEPTEPPAPATAAAPEAGVTETPPGPSAAVLELEEVAVLDAPIAMALRPGDPSLYIAERAGFVRPVTTDGEVGAPIIDLSAMTSTNGERGLLGLAWSADGQTLYLSSTDPEGASVLTAVDAVDDILQASTARTLLRVPQPASNHNGGDLHLGPDGMLWWSLGDGGAADDRFGNGQRPDTLLGTLLRIDPDGADPYAIPPDNPFVDGGGAPEVWAYGLRNPYRFTFDPPTDTLWIADVGQDEVEEIDRVRPDEAGLNYGWPRFEGDQPFDGQQADGPVVPPVHTYRHDRGCSVTGGRVYRGTALPQLQGTYLYSDYCDGRIFALDVAPDGAVRADVDTGLQIASPTGFGVDPAGEVYVLSLNGPVMKVVAR